MFLIPVDLLVLLTVHFCFCYQVIFYKTMYFLVVRKCWLVDHASMDAFFFSGPPIVWIYFTGGKTDNLRDSIWYLRSFIHQITLPTSIHLSINFPTLIWDWPEQIPPGFRLPRLLQLLWVSWVCPEDSFQWDLSETPPGRFQVRRPSRNLPVSFQCRREVILSSKWLSSSSSLQKQLILAAYICSLVH